MPLWTEVTSRVFEGTPPSPPASQGQRLSGPPVLSESHSVRSSGRGGALSQMEGGRLRVASEERAEHPLGFPSPCGPRGPVGVACAAPSLFLSFFFLSLPSRTFSCFLCMVSVLLVPR